MLPELEQISRVDTGRARIIAADILVHAGRSEEAVEIYRSALEQVGSSPFALEAYQRLADLLDREGRQAEAVEVLRKALALHTELTPGEQPSHKSSELRE